jgi:hypothetical protein
MEQARLVDDQTIPIPKHHQFRKAWRWPHAVELFFQQRIEDKSSLHVCCGSSRIGDVRLDIDSDSERTISGDMRTIPFDDCSFDIVFGDWPWKMGYFQRFKPFYEMVRVCKIGGEIIVNSTWLPFSKAAELREIFVRCDSPFGMVSVILVYRKIAGEYD